MAVITFQAARELVIEKILACRRTPSTEFLPLATAQGRVLAAPEIGRAHV